MNMNKKIILAAVILTGGAAAAWQFTDILHPPRVSIAPVEIGPAVEAVYATGTVEPGVLVPIAPRTTSRLASLNADENQDVKAGDILAQLEDADLQADVAQLRAQLNFTEQDLKRKQTLFKSKSISQDVLDTAQAAYDSAKAQVDAAKARAGYLQLIAPADGRIIRRDGEIGEIISANQPVFYFMCCAPLRISSEVDEENISLVKVGSDVLIQSDNFKDRIFHGKVTSITPKGDPEARSFRVRVAFNDAQNPFLIGMTAETNIILRRNDSALLVPSKAVGPHDQIQKIVNGRIEIVKPELGVRGAEQTEIISGLSKGEEVVTPYNTDIAEGKSVITEKATPIKQKKKSSDNTPSGPPGGQ